MKDNFLKILKVALIILAILLVIFLVFGIVLSLDWPLWMGIFLLLILAGLGIGFLFLRKIMLRRREQRFVQQVIEQDEAQLKALTGKERDELKDLQDRWKEAIEALRRSHLRKYGNPLYVLPWYLVMGESGSGKTTAIQSAKLSSPFVEVKRTSGISGTRNCDWWFFEQAIIIDTAGRYAIPVDEGRDKEEWQRFLNLLIKYRKKEPIHGLIVTLAANKLLEAPPDVLEEDGRNIRRRIDELMRVLGVKFPVYVLVTKCDLVQGMTRFCDFLPEKSLDQPMGVTNQDLTKDVSSFLEQAIASLGERLRNLRILLLHQPESKGIDPSFLLFPEEFENLKRGLEPFIKTAFKENPYQETPILRGIFFSSGRQEGTPYSHFLKALGLIGEKEVLPGTSKGLFLHDFFAKILPKDRGLFAPTKRAMEWRILTRNLGLTSWVVLGIAFCGLLSFSFFNNLRAIRETSHEFAKPMVLKGEVLQDLMTMDRFQQAILKVEAKNHNWWVPRFGLTESLKVENGLKEKYCKQFQNVFLTSFDKQMAGSMVTLSPSTSDEIMAQYITHLVRRINLLRARLEGQSLQTLQTFPQPSYDPMMFAGGQTTSPDLKKKFGQLYLYYLVWRSETGEISKEIDVLQAWLKDLLVQKRNNLHWLVVWADRQGLVPSIKLEDFWGGSSSLPGEKMITPSFTRKGKDLIDAFVKELETAFPEPALLTDKKVEFEKWYRQACLELWQGFGTIFPKGVERLRGQKEWQSMATKVATDQGPYFAFINRMALELEPYIKEGGIPSWLQQVYLFQTVKTLSKTGAGGGIIGKATEGGKKLLGSIEKRIGKEIGEEGLDSQLVAAKAYQEYQNALTALDPISTSRNQAFQMVSQAFSEDPATSKSPFFMAYGAASRLKANLGGGRPLDEMIWRLLIGPLEYLWSFARAETACSLQSQWEQTVLAETQGATGAQAIQLLLGTDGLVWKFLKGPASPFITRSLQRGYYPKEVLGGSLPFESPFFTFLTKGAQAQASAMTKQSYHIGIKGLPTDANPDARVKPHSTRLELQCATGNQSLINLNYPVSKTFTWSPETCGEVIFQIEVGDIVLTKRYTGNQGFPEFLQDFPGGRRTFSPSEFPNEKAALDRMGIKFIKVNYQFSGEQQVLGQVRALPGQAPRNIVRCWE